MNSRLVRLVCGCAVMAQLGVGPAQGALAPAYERQRELIAVIEDPDVLSKVEVIEKIEAIAPGKFRVWSARCVVDVSLESNRAGAPMAGGGPFHVRTSAPRCG